MLGTPLWAMVDTLKASFYDGPLNIPRCMYLSRSCLLFMSHVSYSYSSHDACTCVTAWRFSWEQKRVVQSSVFE